MLRWHKLDGRIFHQNSFRRMSRAKMDRVRFHLCRRVHTHILRVHLLCRQRRQFRVHEMLVLLLVMLLLLRTVAVPVVRRFRAHPQTMRRHVQRIAAVATLVMGLGALHANRGQLNEFVVGILRRGQHVIVFAAMTPRRGPDDNVAIFEPLHRFGDGDAARDGERFAGVHLGVTEVYGRVLGGQLLGLLLLLLVRMLLLMLHAVGRVGYVAVVGACLWL